MTRLTLSQKKRLMDYLISRDGFKCYLCELEFTSIREPIIEHINSTNSDNREDNLALAHQSCNIRKIKDKEYWNKAEYKLEYNENHMYVGESFFEKENKESTDASTEIAISNRCYEITANYLTDEISKEGWIHYKGLVHDIVYLCRQKTGHGSEQSIRSHILTLVSKFAPFEVSKNKKGKRIIKKKTIQSS